MKPPLTDTHKQSYNKKIDIIAEFHVEIGWIGDIPIHPTFDPTKLTGKKASDYSIVKNQLLNRKL